MVYQTPLLELNLDPDLTKYATVLFESTQSEADESGKLIASYFFFLPKHLNYISVIHILFIYVPTSRTFQ
jgi:hypothetical protein